ncbi:MAG: glycosyltransferase [Candidatus Acidiferrales bacterium]
MFLTCSSISEVLQTRTLLPAQATSSSDEIRGTAVENLRYWAVPLLTRFVNGLRCGKVLTPRIREFQLDVIIGYFVYPLGFGALQAGRELGIPTVIGAVGSDLRRMNGILVKPLVAQTVKNAAFVTTVSEELRRRAIARGALPEGVRTIHDGCDADIFHPGTAWPRGCGCKWRQMQSLWCSWEHAAAEGNSLDAPRSSISEGFQLHTTAPKGRPMLMGISSEKTVSHFFLMHISPGKSTVAVSHAYIDAKCLRVKPLQSSF